MKSPSRSLFLREKTGQMDQWGLVGSFSVFFSFPFDLTPLLFFFFFFCFLITAGGGRWGGGGGGCGRGGGRGAVCEVGIIFENLIRAR